MRKKSIISIFILGISLTSLYFIYFKLKDTLASSSRFSSSTLPKDTPDMLIDGFVLEETKGVNRDWVLYANKAYMFRDKNKMLFDDVKNIIFAGDGNSEQYKILSNKGSYSIKEDRIELEDNVRISTGSYEFLTEAVSYLAGGKDLESNSKILVNGETEEQGKMKIRGRGLSGNIETGDFNIKGSVFAKIGEELSVESNEALFNINTSRVKFIGNVSSIKEDLRIKGDEMEITYTDRSEIRDMVVRDNVVLNIDERKALCEKAVIETSNNKIILTGRPELHVGNDVMVGERISFFTDSEEVYVERARGDVRPRRL